MFSRVADVYPNLDIIQILSADQTKLYATITSKPVYRRVPTDKPVIEFAERTASTPEAIQAWFYPLTTYGHSFVYSQKAPSKVKASELRTRP